VRHSLTKYAQPGKELSRINDFMLSNIHFECEHCDMNGYIPITAALVFTSLYLFYEINRVAKNKRINRQEERRLRQEEYVKSLKGKRLIKNDPPDNSQE